MAYLGRPAQDWSMLRSSERTTSPKDIISEYESETNKWCENCMQLFKLNKRGRIGLRMFIQTIAGTTIHTIEDTSNEEDLH